MERFRWQVSLNVSLIIRDVPSFIKSMYSCLYMQVSIFENDIRVTCRRQFKKDNIVKCLYLLNTKNILFTFFNLRWLKSIFWNHYLISFILKKRLENQDILDINVNISKWFVILFIKIWRFKVQTKLNNYEIICPKRIKSNKKTPST